MVPLWVHQQQDKATVLKTSSLVAVSVKINRKQSSHGVKLSSLTGPLAEIHICLKSSWVVSGPNPLHCETISNCRKRGLNHQTSTAVQCPKSCPTGLNCFCSSEHSPLKFPTVRSQRHDVRNTVWVCILNDRKAVPVSSPRVHQRNFIDSRNVKLLVF